MATTGTDMRPEPRTPSPQPEETSRTAAPRKPMVRPELTRHGSLPEVTGSFIGTFSP
ncbi:MAG TPA: hypothetical protein VF167_03520 [Longimicrobiaceae bacterium]